MVTLSVYSQLSTIFIWVDVLFSNNVIFDYYFVSYGISIYKCCGSGGGGGGYRRVVLNCYFSKFCWTGSMEKGIKIRFYIKLGNFVTVVLYNKIKLF